MRLVCLSCLLLINLALSCPALGTQAGAAVLTGTQSEKLRRLGPGGTYVVRTQYHVPAGAELRIHAGTTMIAENDALLSVAGTLTVDGTRKAPVTFRGKASGRSAWKGIKIEKSDTSVIRFAEIRGAEVAVHVHHCKPTIFACMIVRNAVGVKAGAYGSGSTPHIEHCVIAENKEHGIELVGSGAKIVRCEIRRNGGWGIRGFYYASPDIERTIISENGEGGIWCQHYECSVVAHECAIYKNSKCEMRNHGSKDWDCSRNWWGETSTRILRKQGEGANLKCIEDGLDPLEETKGSGIVRLTDFLPDRPRVCGASLAEAERQGAVGKGTKLKFARACYVVLSSKDFNGFHKAVSDENTGEVKKYVQAGYVIKIEEGTSAVALVHCIR